MGHIGTHSTVQRIARRWAAEERSHLVLVFTSDASLARSRATIGGYVQVLHDLMTEHPDLDAFVDRVHWLP